MSTGTAWQPGAEEPLVLTTPADVLDKPPRRWPVPLMVLLAVLLGTGAGAWIAGNNERVLDSTTERLVEVSDQLEAARGELATVRDDLATAQDTLTRLQGAERRALQARRDHAAALEDLEQTVVASAALFDALPPSATAGLSPAPGELAVLTSSIAAANAGDAEGYRGTFTRDGRLSMIAAGLRNELRADDLGTVVSPSPRLRLVGAPAAIKSFIWTRYQESSSSGVMVTRLQDGKILHQWIVVRTW